jgi:hypothetical protein
MANEKEQMAMPLQNEMQLANWISGMFGKTANPNYTGATVAAPQLVNQMSGQDMQNLMTEFMRGQGGFLQSMQQARQSGLYNSNTQRLVANDITAQAALKATQANVPIQQGNASLMNQYYAKQGALQPKYLPGNKSKENALGALAIAGLQKLMQGEGKKGAKGKKEDPATAAKEGTGEEAPQDFMSAMGDKLSEIFGSGSVSPDLQVGSTADIPQMSFDPQSMIGDFAGANQDYGMSIDPGLSFNFDQGDYSYDYQPDTYDSFYDSYGTNPGYDFQDYDEYFFD